MTSGAKKICPFGHKSLQGPKRCSVCGEPLIDERRMVERAVAHDHRSTSHKYEFDPEEGRTEIDPTLKIDREQRATDNDTKPKK